MEAKEKSDGLAFLVLFLMFLYMTGARYYERYQNNQERISDLEIHLEFKKKCIKKIKGIRKENNNFKTHLTTMNGWVDDCWSCSKLKKDDKEMRIFLLEQGTRN
jgi:hypothetical protein